jgi:hypothetical protein
LGTSYTRPTRSGKEIFLSLMANPSHLEAVNPLVMGGLSVESFVFFFFFFHVLVLAGKESCLVVCLFRSVFLFDISMFRQEPNKTSWATQLEIRFCLFCFTVMLRLPDKVLCTSVSTFLSSRDTKLVEPFTLSSTIR